MREKSKKKPGRDQSRPLIERVNPNAAGIDCGSGMHFVAVPRDRDSESVRSFKTFTDDLERLADWLVRCGIKTVAMEATGVCHASEQEITGAMTGHYRPEHLFVLKQNLELWDAIQKQIVNCDTEIENHIKALTANLSPTINALPEARLRQKARHNEPKFEIREPLHALSGVDLSQIDGIGPTPR